MKSWTPLTRLLVFALASSSIASLILHFYGWTSMRFAVCAFTLPSFLTLVVVAWFGRNEPTGRRLNLLVVGAVAGLVACIAYDLFRLPFVLLKASGSVSAWALPLFKVFPAFGALILGERPIQTSYSATAHLLGWTYHFSNGIGFGLMYVAALGDPLRRSWLWAIAMALGLEGAMLLMPYASLFEIRVSWRFVAVTCAAHAIFGVALGLTARQLSGETANNHP